MSRPAETSAARQGEQRLRRAAVHDSCCPKRADRHRHRDRQEDDLSSGLSSWCPRRRTSTIHMIRQVTQFLVNWEEFEILPNFPVHNSMKQYVQALVASAEKWQCIAGARPSDRPGIAIYFRVHPQILPVDVGGLNSQGGAPRVQGRQIDAGDPRNGRRQPPSAFYVNVIFGRWSILMYRGVTSRPSIIWP